VYSRVTVLIRCSLCDRVLCYNAGLKDASLLGEPEREYNDDTLGRVFAIAYNQKGTKITLNIYDDDSVVKT
jgi:hypothetical protein